MKGFKLLVALRCLALAMPMAFAHAQGDVTVQALGETITFSNPPGMCTIGDSPAERYVLDRTRRALGANYRLLHVAYPCDELQRLRKGERIDNFSHWTQVQLVSKDGDFRKLPVTRAQYIDLIAGSVDRVDRSSVERLVEDGNQRIQNEVRVEAPAVQAFGKDHKAFYLGVTASVSQAGGNAQRFFGYGSATLAHGMPIGIWGYSTDAGPAGRKQAQALSHAILDSMKLPD